MNESSPINCAVYARVSTDHGLNQEFNSIHAQIESCQHYIAMNRHQGWTLNETEHIFTDEAISGGTTERPALQQMLKLVKAGKLQVVVIYKIDRLSRNLRDFIDMQELFTKHGCSLASTTESFDTSTSMGRAMLNLVGVFAQLERERTRERIIDKISATKARGLWVGGVVPYGYEAKEGKLIINKALAKLVKQIFEMRSQGAYPQAIATELRKQSTPFFSSRNGKSVWSSRHIHSILRCPVYAGYIQHKEKLYKGIHQSIIDEELWQEVQGLIKTVKAVSKKDPLQYPLRGLMTCEQCGARFITTHTTKKGVCHRYYVCSNRQKNGKEVCDCPILPAEATEQHLAHELQEICQVSELEKLLHRSIPEYKGSLVSECLDTFDKWVKRLTPKQLQALLEQAFEHISFKASDNAFLLTRRNA